MAKDVDWSSSRDSASSSNRLVTAESHVLPEGHAKYTSPSAGKCINKISGENSFLGCWLKQVNIGLINDQNII